MARDGQKSAGKGRSQKRAALAARPAEQARNPLSPEAHPATALPSTPGAQASRQHAKIPGSRSRRIIAVAAAIAAVGAAAIAGYVLLDGRRPDPPASAIATYVGSDACASCHRGEADRWGKSQHKVAMQHATETSVLGDFNDAGFDYFGIHSKFFRRDGKFLVETDGQDGKLATFAVKYTFGIDPLQQYLVEFPDGRLQALPIAWDTRPKDKGGQRWFHLYPDEPIRHDDVLHWTRLNQNWNFMCAECHSTGVRKNYDAAEDVSPRISPRSASAARPVTAKARTMSLGRVGGAAGGHSDGLTTRKRACSSRSMSATASPGPPVRAPASRNGISHRRGCARRSRPAASATPAAADFPKTGRRDNGSRTRMWCRRSPAASTRPTGRCGTRCIITARSSRAKCSPRASPAAIAMSRTAVRYARRWMASVCNATPAAMRAPAIIATRG